jgi:hypothetical protein
MNMQIAESTSAYHRETIRVFAADAFKGHVAERIGDAGDTKVYRFARPGTGMYAVRILFWPGWVVVAGDTGDTLFRHSSADSLRWARDSVADVGYMLGKVQGPRKRFMYGDAKAFIAEVATNYGEFAADKRPTLGGKGYPAAVREEGEGEEDFAERAAGMQRLVDEERADFDTQAKGCQERAEELQAAWAVHDDEYGPDGFHSACQLVEVDDPPDCTDYESDHLWAVEALRHFIRVLDAEEPRFLLRTGPVGDCILFWRKGDAGYTTDLDAAARYTLSEAKRRARYGVDEILEESAVFEAVCKHVDSERLRPRALGAGT